MPASDTPASDTMTSGPIPPGSVPDHTHEHFRARWLLAFIFFVTVTFIGFYRTGDVSDRVDAESRKRTAALCQQGYENRLALRKLIERSTSQTITIPPNADPALVEVIKESQRANEQFRLDVLADLPLPDCNAVVDVPSSKP